MCNTYFKLSGHNRQEKSSRNFKFGIKGTEDSHGCRQTSIENNISQTVI